MRILQTIASVSSEGGGPVESLKQVGRLLQERGHTCDVVSLDNPEAECVQNFPLPIYPLGPSFSFYRYSSRLTPWLKENHSNYDCVLVRGIWRYNSFGVWRALQNTQTPYFVFTHGMLDPWFRRHYPIKHFKKCLFWPWGEYRVLRDAQAVLFTSEEERVQAKRSFRPYQCNEVVVSYGTEGPEGNLDELRSLFLASHPELSGKQLLLFLGRIHVKKGCDLLLKALSSVMDQDLHLVIAGPDQTGWQKVLEQQAHQLEIAGRITWTGMLEGKEKWGALAAAEAFVLPSHQENFGIAVVEALACGTPVLISDQVNIWREIMAAGAGLVSEDTVSGTTDLLQRWLDLPENERDSMRHNAKECFKRTFGLETAAQSLLDALAASPEHDSRQSP